MRCAQSTTSIFRAPFGIGHGMRTGLWGRKSFSSVPHGPTLYVRSMAKRIIIRTPGDIDYHVSRLRDSVSDNDHERAAGERTHIYEATLRAIERGERNPAALSRAALRVVRAGIKNFG